MFQRAVALLLQRLLGKFVSFDASMLQLSLWQGDLAFSNLELRLGMGKGTIGHLSVNIPWRALWTQSVVIKAQGIRIWAHHPSSMAMSADSPTSQMEAHGNEKVDAEELDSTEAMDQPVDDRSYLSKLLSSLISNVQIELVDVQIRYDCMEDSSAKLPGSATLAVDQVNFINADADWQLAFTSHASISSRKLLTTTGIAAYIEYEDFHKTPCSSSSQSTGLVRKYLFHDWTSIIKASLCYTSANASFPDVDLNVQLGCSKGHKEEEQKCSICAMYEFYRVDPLVKDLADDPDQDENTQQWLAEPRVHFDSDHIDVLYAILIEVKAPYDEYDRLAVLSEKQASRSEGFLTVLAYAKQWLISDCLDGLGDSKAAMEGYGSNDEDSDDDDEFEDAITPPSLSISTCLDDGVKLFFFSRGFEEQSEITRRRWWLFSLGKTRAFLKQSCIEDEIHINVKSLYCGEFQEANAAGNLVQSMKNEKQEESNEDEPDLVEFSCIIPAYQSRLVGHQPVSKLRICEKLHIAIGEKTMMLWMTLFTPVWYSWNNWNLSHPSKRKIVDENRIAPIADVTYAIEGIELFYFVNDTCFFGAEVTGMNVSTHLTSENVSCSYSVGMLRILSGKLESANIISMADIDAHGIPCHEIIQLQNIVLTESSHSRTRWCNDDYICLHSFDEEWTLSHENIQDGYASRSIYHCELAIASEVNVSLQIEEIESIMWAIGKWSYYSFDSSVSSPFSKCPSKAKELCRTTWSVRIPGISLSLTQPAETLEGSNELLLNVDGLEYQTAACVSHTTTSLVFASIQLLHQNKPILSVAEFSSLKSNRIDIITRSVQRNISVIPIIGPHVLANNGNAEILSYAQDVYISLERVDGVISPAHCLVILDWIHSCQEKQEFGLICAGSYGFDLESFAANLKRIRAPVTPVLMEPTLRRLSITAVRGISLSVLHAEVKSHAALESDMVQELGMLESGFASMIITNNDLTQRIQSGEERNLRITLRNLQLIDLTNPKDKSWEMLHRKVITSNIGSINANDSGSFLARNSVDILIVTPYITQKGTDSNTLPGKVAKIRFDSVCVTYLHRVYKQFSHYMWEHFLPMIWSEYAITGDKALDVYELFDIDIREFAVSVEEMVRMYLASGISDDPSKARGYTKYELLANDLSFVIPRTSFSTKCITLRCTNARFWSAEVDSNESDFLQNGTLSDEGRLSQISVSGATMTKVQQVKRMELRNLKRLIKNQRSRLLNNRSQLYIDLKNATQLKHTYLHEGRVSPEADEAVGIIDGKIKLLDTQLELLNQHLKNVDDSIDKAKDHSDSEFYLSDPSLITRCRTESMETIKESVANMSKHLIGSLFTGENAEFFDARVMVAKDTVEEDMSSSNNNWFEFELVDLDGVTSGSDAPLFHHALVTGRIDSETEALAKSLSPYLNLSLSLNEMNVGLNPVQYTTVLGMIFENFKEVGSVVNEDTFAICPNCGGYHYDYQLCNAIWLKIPVKVMDATLRVSNQDHCIADVCFEQLDLAFMLRTDYSLEITASALTINVIDMRSERCVTALEILRSMGGDGVQIAFRQMTTCTESFYELDIQHTSLVVIYDAIYQLIGFFIAPFWAVNEFMDYNVGFMCPPPPEWKLMELQARYTNSCFCLLEDFMKSDSRALVALTNMSYTYNATQACDDSSDMRKIHVNMDQRGFYISALPGLEFDASYPVVNSFQLVFDHFVRWDSMSRRNSFVLEPVEARLSIQDSFLLINIVNNYLKKITAKPNAEDEETKPEENDDKAAFSANTTFASDKLLGDVGEIRVVLVNNLLSVPIADIHVTDIECEHEQDDRYSTSIGGIMSSNYFNNSIYRWEPLVEPFKIQMRVERALGVDSRAEVFVNLPFAVNLNLTPEMAPLLSSDALRQADFVTTGSKTTAPFWIQNKTGMEVKFSFRRGKGTVTQQFVPDDAIVPVDCREQSDMRSFDSASSDRLVQQSDNNYLTVNHTISVWTNNNKWKSSNPVIVDVVGHVSIPLHNSANFAGDKQPKESSGVADTDEFAPPVLVAEISIQADGSKLISLHSQVVLQNRTSVPLMIWAFTPRGGKDEQHVFEWIVDREQVCHVPLNLIHPNSKISVRPSPNVQYAPLATSLEDFGDEYRIHKQSRTKRFIRGGSCVCNFEVFDSAWEVENTWWQPSDQAASAVCPLSGFVVRDFAPWRCTYDVEAYYLMRAALMTAEDQKKEPEHKVLRKEDDDDEEFRQLFSKNKNTRRKNDRLEDIQDQLEDVTQHRGLYEATNYSMYHLSVSPFLVLHNHLASPVAYRIMISSLQLIAEGIIGVGNMLPLFQIDGSSLLYLSFRLENYNWSTPTAVIHPTVRALSVPYKEHYLGFELQGRTFDREVVGEQGNVPNLQLNLKLLGRDIFLFCSYWIVNHSGLCLEYCNSTSLTPKKLEGVLKYIHDRPTKESIQDSVFMSRSISYYNPGPKDEMMLTRLQHKSASIVPVVVIVAVQKAEGLINPQFFGIGTPYPYVRATLYAPKPVREAYADRVDTEMVCFAETKPVAAVKQPKGTDFVAEWDTQHQNTLLLRFPRATVAIQRARIQLEVRNTQLGSDKCIGITAIPVATIMKDLKQALAFKSYRLIKKRSGEERNEPGAAKKPPEARGSLYVSFSVGTTQELSIHDGDSNGRDSFQSPMADDERRSSIISPQESAEYDGMIYDDEQMLASQTPSFLPQSGMLRSIQKLHTPAQNPGLIPTDANRGASAAPMARKLGPSISFTDLDSTRAHGENFDSTTMRPVHASPLKPPQGSKTFPLRVYLPTNRFVFVTVEVAPSYTWADVFQLVCLRCGFEGIFDKEDFDFYQLVAPRFVSLRSAGRPESERWYGKRFEMQSKVGSKKGRKYGLHLCHRMTMTTIRLYDEASTASPHHFTPRPLLLSAKKNNPAQNSPVAWGEVLLYGSQGSKSDVLRIKHKNTPWSEVVRLRRNAMGNSGVAQVITLVKEEDVGSEATILQKSQIELALWTCYGTGRFADTIIATIAPRYILINRTGSSLKYRQDCVPSTCELPSQELKAFHWSSSTEPKYLQVTFSHGEYGWSARFRIHSLGTTYLKLRRSIDQSQIYILQCQTEMVGGSIVLIFREESKRWPPYRIDNTTSFRIQFTQANWTARDARYDELGPRSTCPYSWDSHDGLELVSTSTSAHVDPNVNNSQKDRFIKIRFMRVSSSSGQGDASQHDAAIETREYNLDQMASHRRIQLQRSLPSQLFIKPDKKGYLLKKDNLLKWNKKYFRFYDCMLYYFASEEDQDLLGVIDLRAGESVPGAGHVAIYEKVEPHQRNSFMSLNGLVSSISGTIFGSSSFQDGLGDRRAEEEDEQARSLVQLAVSMTASSYLSQESDRFVKEYEETQHISRKGFFVCGYDLVEFLVQETNYGSKDKAFEVSQEMLTLGVLSVANTDDGDPKKSPMNATFHCSKRIWYCVNSINLAEETDSMESGDDIAVFNVTPSTDKNATWLSQQSDFTAQKPPTSNQFSIITASKCYELKAKNPKMARAWVLQLRKAILAGRATNSTMNNSNNEDESSKSTTTASGTTISSTTTAAVNTSSNAKTYVHVRIRADGPTKVLELFEGGEEDYDETEVRNEIVSECGSNSPTASESSIATTNNGELTNAISIHVSINSFGVSCVNEVPRELVYAYFGGVWIRFSRNSNRMKLMVTLDDFQVDNQHEGATFTKLLCPRIRSDAAQTHPHVQTVDEDNPTEAIECEVDMPEEEEDQLAEISLTKGLRCHDCGSRVDNASMHFCCTWSSEQGGSTEYFKHCSVWLCPIVVQLDEELLISCRDFLNSMEAVATHKKLENSDSEIRRKSIPIETMAESLREFKENISSDELDPLMSLHSYNSNTSSSERRKIYFALLHIHPIEFDITYRSDVLQFSAQLSLREARNVSFSTSSRSSEDFKRSASMDIMQSIKGHDTKEDKDNKTSESWAIPSLGMHIPDLDNAPVRLTALQLQHVFGTSGELSRRVTKYYTRQLWKQLHKILGSFDFLGNPVGFFDHIGTGVKDFVYEPYEGLKVGAKGFRKGLAKGTASLVSNTLDGTFDAASKISGTFGQGLATMSFDDHYQQKRARARRRHVHGIRDGLIQGSRELSIGVIEGVTGLVMAPVRGAEQGALGFVKGTITGILGLPIKPVAGIFDFASRATQGIRSRSLRHDLHMRRVRRPRVFGRYNELKVYKEDDTIAYDLLKKTGGERLSGEKIIYYFEIIQSIPAMDMADEGRKKHQKTRARSDSKLGSTSAGANNGADTGYRSTPRELDPGENGPKLVYEVTFHEKKLGLELETDFYCENVTIKTTTEDCCNYTVSENAVAGRHPVLQEGDCLIGVGGVSVKGIGFHETLALLRGTARPITLQFESCEEFLSSFAPSAGDTAVAENVAANPNCNSPLQAGTVAVAEDDGARLKVQVIHWLIVTEERVLYINVGSFALPVVEWTTPLPYIYRIELIKNTASTSSNNSCIYLHLRVGVDSLPTGPRLRPSWKLVASHERDMEVFTSVMKKSFGHDNQGQSLAEEQELWPSDRSLNGFLLKKGSFTTNKRWFVLSRNCLYYFLAQDRDLRGVIPLGNVTIETDTRETMSLRITNAELNEPLVTLQMDHGQVVEKVQREIVLLANSAQDVEMWSSSLTHAAGNGLRNSRGTRFFTPSANSRLEIGCRDTPEFIVASLAETLKKTIDVFGHPISH